MTSIERDENFCRLVLDYLCAHGLVFDARRILSKIKPAAPCRAEAGMTIEEHVEAFMRAPVAHPLTCVVPRARVDAIETHPGLRVLPPRDGQVERAPHPESRTIVVIRGIAEAVDALPETPITGYGIS